MSGSNGANANTVIYELNTSVINFKIIIHGKCMHKKMSINIRIYGMLVAFPKRLLEHDTHY